MSNGSVPDAENMFRNLEDIVVDSANNQALVATSGSSAVYGVNLTTGERSILSNNSIPNADIPFSYLVRAIALDSVSNRVLVVDESLRAVVSVDLTSGERSILSDSSTPNANNTLFKPTSITLDRANNRALVTDTTLDAVVAVDLVFGGAHDTVR